MKQITNLCIATAILCASFANVGKSENDSRAKSNFALEYPNAAHVVWSIEKKNKLFNVCFESNKILHRASYNPFGKIEKLIRYYSKAEMPITLANKLNQDFDYATIFGVTEITIKDSTIYSVVLETLKTWISVIGDKDGNYKIESKINKS